ncbi:MAG: MmcQ-like protein [Bacteroidetes bacterium GWE2_29_8]|nr:MAG: MmcQ-like protein [Bacteroidetes bacterium GWE2_29_8]OFY19140.1 MAG: MmcQ-like protein [Bacteroidetes bacterium GWF2_29_10]
MDIELIRDYCVIKTGVEESMPFGNDILVFKVYGKMFALLNLKEPFSLNLKCEPEYSIKLQEEYSSIKAGYHMNKKHWITVIIDYNITGIMLNKLIDDSYNLVKLKLPKKYSSISK